MVEMTKSELRSKLTSNIRNICYDTSKSDGVVISEYYAYIKNVKLIEDGTKGILNNINTSSLGYNKSTLDFRGLDVSEITDMSYWFTFNNRYVSCINITGWDTSNVTNMQGMFKNCGYRVSNIDGLEDLNTSNVTDMSYMFYDSGFSSNMDFSKWNTSKVKNMSYMFYGSSDYNRQNLNISTWDVSNVTNMSHMFDLGGSFEDNVNLANWNTKNVTDMSYMFKEVSTESIDLFNFDTSNVIDMTGMFNGCESLIMLKVSNLDTRKVQKMDGMFAGCTRLGSLNLENFVTTQATINGMFSELGATNTTKAQIKIKPENWDTKLLTSDLGVTFIEDKGLTALMADDFAIVDDTTVTLNTLGSNLGNVNFAINGKFLTIYNDVYKFTIEATS